MSRPGNASTRPPASATDQGAGGQIPRVEAPLVVGVVAATAGPAQVQGRPPRSGECRGPGGARAPPPRPATPGGRPGTRTRSRPGPSPSVDRPDATRQGRPLRRAPQPSTAAQVSSRTGRRRSPPGSPVDLRRHRHRELGYPEQEVGRAVERIHDPPDARDPGRAVPSSPSTASSGRRSARTRATAASAARSTSDTMSVDDDLVSTGGRLPSRPRDKHAARGLGSTPAPPLPARQQERLGARRAGTSERPR